MNALVPVTQLPPGVLTTAEMAATMSYGKCMPSRIYDPISSG